MRKGILGIIAGLITGAVLLSPVSAHITGKAGHNWKKHYLKLAKKAFYTKAQVDELLAETPETGSVSVGRYAFAGRSDPSFTFTRNATGACPNDTVRISAPVSLPDGVRVTSFTVHWYDGNNTEAMVVQLVATRHVDDSETILGSIGTIGSPGDGMNTQTLATPHVVDNATFAYEVTTASVNTNLCVRSAVIGYTET